MFIYLSASAPWIRCYCLQLLQVVCWLLCGALCKLIRFLVLVHVPILLPYLCHSTEAGGEAYSKALFDVSSNKKKANCIKNHLCSTETNRLDGTDRPNPVLCYCNISYSIFCSQGSSFSEFLLKIQNFLHFWRSLFFLLSLPLSFLNSLLSLHEKCSEISKTRRIQVSLFQYFHPGYMRDLHLLVTS